MCGGGGGGMNEEDGGNSYENLKHEHVDIEFDDVIKLYVVKIIKGDAGFRQ